MVGLTVAFAAASSPDAIASVRCAHGEPPANRLTVTPYTDPSIDLDFSAATIRRDGDQIKIGDVDLVTCSGPPPTLQNTESIDVIQRGLSFARLALAGGPLAPGGSPETDGTSEVEVQFVAKRHSLAYGLISGTGGPDDWVLGRQDGVTGASLSPQRPAEFDATYIGPGRRIVVASGRAGNDIIRAGGIGPVAALRSRSLLEGNRGADFLEGGKARDFLQGGSGADQLRGLAGPDLLTGGHGEDRLFGGPGGDRLYARDQSADHVFCGPGHDKARVDKRDTVRGCEVVKRHRRTAFAPQGRLLAPKSQ